MQWGNNRKLEFSLNYDERNGCWKARVQTSNRHGFTKKFKTCKEANDWYAKYKEDYISSHRIRGEY